MAERKFKIASEVPTVYISGFGTSEDGEQLIYVQEGTQIHYDDEDGDPIITETYVPLYISCKDTDSTDYSQNYTEITYSIVITNAADGTSADWLNVWIDQENINVEGEDEQSITLGKLMCKANPYYNDDEINAEDSKYKNAESIPEVGPPKIAEVYINGELILKVQLDDVIYKLNMPSEFNILFLSGTKGGLQTDTIFNVLKAAVDDPAQGQNFRILQYHNVYNKYSNIYSSSRMFGLSATPSIPQTGTVDQVPELELKPDELFNNPTTGLVVVNPNVDPGVLPVDPNEPEQWLGSDITTYWGAYADLREFYLDKPAPTDICINIANLKVMAIEKSSYDKKWELVDTDSILLRLSWDILKELSRSNSKKATNVYGAMLTGNINIPEFNVSFTFTIKKGCKHPSLFYNDHVDIISVLYNLSCMPSAANEDETFDSVYLITDQNKLIEFNSGYIPVVYNISNNVTQIDTKFVGNFWNIPVTNKTFKANNGDTGGYFTMKAIFTPELLDLANADISEADIEEIKQYLLTNGNVEGDKYCITEFIPLLPKLVDVNRFDSYLQMSTEIGPLISIYDELTDSINANYPFGTPIHIYAEMKNPLKTSAG